MKSASARRRKPTPTSKSKPAKAAAKSATARAKSATAKAGAAKANPASAPASARPDKTAGRTATKPRPNAVPRTAVPVAAKAGDGNTTAKPAKASTKATSGNGRAPATASTPASPTKVAPNTVSVTTEAKSRRRRRAVPAGIAPSEPERDILDQYLYEVSTYPLLKGHEEIDIARKIRAGDADALQELVKRNLRFVISVAKKYQNRGLPLIDLIGEGNVGLLTAARKFDPDQGVKFISYAVWWIRQAILSSLARQGRTVRVPLNRTADLSRIIKASEILRQKLRREPMPEELAQLTGLSVDVVQSLAALNTGDVRLDAPMDPDGDRSLIERFVADEMPDTEEEAMNRFLNDEVEAALNTLPPRDAKVLRLYFGLEGGREHTLEEIGSMLGVTRERVRQLRDRALKRLREGEVGRALGSFAA
jgi:RNA polymerase primary sigma factor